MIKNFQEKTSNYIVIIVKVVFCKKDFLKTLIFSFKWQNFESSVCISREICQLSHISNDETRTKFGFYRPAHDLIKRLDPSLITFISIDEFSIVLFTWLYFRWVDTESEQIAREVLMNKMKKWFVFGFVRSFVGLFFNNEHMFHS